MGRARSLVGGGLATGSICVYAMRMSRVNVYLPDELAAQAKRAGLNVSSLTQDAIRSALAADNVEAWLSKVSALTPTGVDHDEVLTALEGAKRELEGSGNDADS